MSAHPATDDLDLLLETLLGADGPRPRHDVLSLLCEKTTDVIDCDQVVIRLADEQRTVLREAALWSRQPLADRHIALIRTETLAVGDLSGSIVGRGRPAPSLEAFRSGEVQVVATDSTDEFLPAAMCAAPLMRRGTAIGVMAMYWLQPHRPGTAELSRIRTAARHAAIVIEASTRFEALTAQVHETHDELQHARSAESAEGDVARVQGRLLELLATGEPIADDILDLLGAEGVRGAQLRFGPGEDSPGIAIAAAGAVFGALSWEPASPEPDERIVRGAARAIGTVLHQRERERRLTSARQAALTSLVHDDASPAALREAETLLGLDESQRSTLLVAEFDEPDAAFSSVRLLSSAHADGGTDATTAVASGARVIALCRSAAEVRRTADRLAAMPAYRGTGVAGPLGAGAIVGALRDASTAARVSRSRGGRTVAIDELGPLGVLVADVPAAVAADLVADALGPLLAYDRRHDAHLVETLSAYLSHRGSVQAAGRTLHVHLNTVKQRLARIEQLIGADVRDYAVTARLLLALEWRSVLGDDALQ